ncbi:MAG: hypothetical protein QM817_23075 [Archangium sp.]
MGWNAGGFGAMTFPDQAALDAWKQTTVDHAKWDDWINELEDSYDVEESVADRLESVAKRHDARAYNIQQVTIEGLTVALVYDTGEDGFREGSADIAALVRSADEFKAKGRFHFLGTAGAEGDFVYQLTLTGKGSKLKELSLAAGAKVYDSKDYQAFNNHLLALFEEANPEFRARVQKARKGTPSTPKTQGLREKIIAPLAAFPDEMLATTARKYPAMLPDGKKSVMAPQLFKATKQVRAQLTESTNQEVLAVALWVVGEISTHLGVQLALEAYETSTDEELRTGALRVFARAGDSSKDIRFSQANADRALAYLIDVFVKRAPMGMLLAATESLLAIKHAALADAIRAALPKMHKPLTEPQMVTHGGQLMRVIRARKLKALADVVAELALSKADQRERLEAAALLLEWDDARGLKQLTSALGEEYGVGEPAAKALLRVDPKRALEVVRSGKDREVHHVLRAIDADVAANKKKALLFAKPEWVEACLTVLERGDHYLTYTALPILGRGPRSKQVLERIEALMNDPKVNALLLIEPLKGQGSKSVKKLLEARIARSTNPVEQRSLRKFI